VSCLQVGYTGDHLEVLSVPVLSVITSTSIGINWPPAHVCLTSEVKRGKLKNGVRVGDKGVCI
jgi:subtilase family serine protease